ncbi:MAG: hypothetical protein AAF502_14145 [Bacteroidota bacterium]
MKFIRDFLVIFLITFICCEVVVRLFGYSPYRVNPFSIDSEPSLALLPDSRLGFVLNPGNYQLTVNDHVTYSVTHLPDSNRVTTFEIALDSFPKGRIDVHGCSFTYGWGVDDSLSFPFLLQNALPEWDVRNEAVPGFGTLNSLLVIEDQIKRQDKPDIILLNYAGFHDERNALAPNYRKALKHGFEHSNSAVKPLLANQAFPYGKISGDSLLVISQDWDSMYNNWPLRKVSALIHFFQYVNDQQLESYARSFDVTKLIFEAIKTQCVVNDIRLIVCGITDDAATSAMLDNLVNKGFETYTTGIDLTELQYNHLPHDSHPNAAAHQIFTEEALQYLREGNPQNAIDLDK